MSDRTTPVIVAACRTPIGRAHAEKGCYRDVRAEDLLVPVLAALVARTGIDPALIEDLLVGCAQQVGEQGGNIARIAALLADWPVTCAGATINRWCGSSLDALRVAALAIKAGEQDVQAVAGVEHMHHLPMERGWDNHPALHSRIGQAALSMGLTAEFLANKFGITRAEQDAWALQSHRRAASAYDNGAFEAELIPILGRDEQGTTCWIRRDQSVRADTGAAALAGLPAAFLPGIGSVTAGNSSPRNDGAAGLLVMSADSARRFGLTIRAVIRATAVAGIEPSLMGLGPTVAVPRALQKAGMSLDQIDLIELNEAFAVQTLACIRQLQLDPERVNVHGGAIALGHPLGASGARIITTLLHALEQRNKRFGLATMCIGLGQGIAVILERPTV